ncbi:TIGR02281 family clan AA aspartic protease [Novosphingobium sp. FSY-8]|uniref:TIGR02281 family clan AA aspartic protease n=1 Tax=Novosphingobium ovatum TaxID=1908523 RepID=A0ABW9XAZ7_9SPHN|nr:TIGR02281 family clan AA aspartic protease [Novosphingobium ovatum]NBC35703.1 TIGR02281 family clan AA aspartic protease [Novosphingobium ovatum]
MAMLNTLIELPNPLVLGAAFAFMALVLVGGIIRNEVSAGMGMVLRVIGNTGLAISFGVTLLQLGGAFTGMTSAAHAAEVDVNGMETRIPMGSDGHFWITAKINGVDQRFLVDTGATYTTVSSDVADRAGLVPVEDEKAGIGRVMLHTANGDTPADMARIDHVQVGSIDAERMPAVIAPGIGTTNVLGMNFLSGLKSWRVEDNTLILMPR